MAAGITQGEILEALAASLRSTAPSDAKTTQELMAEHGLSVRHVTRALRQYAAEGRLAVHRVPRQQIDGSYRAVPAYTIKPSPKAKRSRRSR